MRILVASDSFKGSLSSADVARVLDEELGRGLPGAEVVRLPVGDGGEGTLDAVCEAAGVAPRLVRVAGPLGEPRDARLGVLPGGRAMVESAEANGLVLVPEDRRDPMAASTYGVGGLVLAALDAGCRELVVGVGGSATNDGGTGMARALGCRLLDADGRELAGTAADLARVRTLDLAGMDPRLAGCRVRVMCDVSNPLTGPEGATFVFGPQKGLSRDRLAPLDEAMGSWAACVARATGRDLSGVPGTGAAGGLAFGLAALLGAELASGIDCVLDLVGFDAALARADLCVTGEGHLDAQTASGKVVCGVARRCAAAGVPCVAVVGGADPTAVERGLEGLSCVVPCVGDVCSTAEALAAAERNLRLAARRLAALLGLGGALPWS